MKSISSEDFAIYLSWTVSVLETQDPQVIRAFKQEAKHHLDVETLTNVLIAALHHLAETNFETLVWALHNYDPEFYVEVRRRTTLAAARQLIRQGLVPGKDFSSIPVGGLMVYPEARAILFSHATPFTEFLLKEVLYTFQKARLEAEEGRNF